MSADITRSFPGSPAYVGHRVARREDYRYVTGQGQYLDDLALPRLVHAAFVRSPFPHAQIRRVDLATCRSLLGVLDALDGAEAARHLRPIRGVLEGLGAWGEWWPLAVERVRFAGEAVASVIATDSYLAEDAAAAVHVEYDPLSPLPDSNMPCLPMPPNFTPTSPRTPSFG